MPTHPDDPAPAIAARAFQAFTALQRLLRMASTEAGISDHVAAHTLLSLETGPSPLGRETCERLFMAYVDDTYLADRDALAIVLLGAAATPTRLRARVLTHALAMEQRVIVRRCLKHPSTSLRAIRAVLRSAPSPEYRRAAAAHPHVLRDPQCRRLLAAGSEAFIALALTRSAEPTERATWLERLAQQHPRTAATAVARGDFAGWPGLENVIAILMGSKNATIRAQAFHAIPVTAISGSASHPSSPGVATPAPTAARSRTAW